ncbi:MULTISPECIES: ABC transporter permease [unclassified Bacillus (in: firmicutes)]|uniref:PhnE/PtxC family ABC transporter permease n=1 Tax=unclassified Bacillus (in: firmicutes) TaxID=185979 RepID=UPI001BECEB5D|nr:MULTISPECIES: ABC transporter permease subunit [unclassified Bacillus (in: firmicutes)]MBT2725113.1 ABC transporter permease subunit [Bacillus sp. ISL-46]MBT2744416.1 ABC transporter permease subunit [Bacillus sp. ISL-77]
MLRRKSVFGRYNRLILTLLLIAVFVWSLFSIHWNADLFHAGGIPTMMQIFEGIIQPDLATEVLIKGLESAWITLAYAVAGMSLAVVYALIVGILASGTLTSGRVARLTSKVIFRGVLGFTRSIHELIWAWLFVAAVGLSPYAAIFALAIPYGGILGRIFADMLNDVPEEPITALKSTGASRLQILIYGYLPLIWADMISYTMYRFECAIRSSAIMSFIGLGGLGYQIQLSLADLKYDQVWAYVFFLIALVFFVDIWSNYVRKGLTDSKRRSGFSSGWRSSLFVMLLVIGSWVFIIVGENAKLFELLSDKNIEYAKKFFGSLIGLNDKHPAFLNAKSWSTALKLTLETLEMSIMAIGFATIAAFLTVIPAARNIANGSLTSSKHLYNWILYGIIRITYIFSRSVPELVWAMMIIFIFKPGLLPGAIALALHNFGILGKLWAEVIEDMDPRPIRNLASAGASKIQIFFYGILPSVLPRFLTYILYRWEVIMRTTIVVGFVGAGGLGMEFKLAMSYFQYTEITLLLLCYMILVVIADFASESTRKSVK